MFKYLSRKYNLSDTLKRIAEVDTLCGEASHRSTAGTNPEFTVNNEQALLHIIGIRRNNSLQTVCTVEIWGKFQDSERFTWLATESKSPCMVHFSESVKNKAISYRLRWINFKGEYSGWSEIQNIEIK